MKIIIMSGLPASGKSTKAKELIELYGNYVRVNRDLLRKMLHFDKWTPLNEKVTIQVEKAIIKEIITSGKNVIIDDTNLGDTKNKWIDLAKSLDANWEVIEINTPIEECIFRDLNRKESVGKHVIINMARRNKIFINDLPDVICDLDGTLCNIEHRTHFVEDVNNKDWHHFFEAMSDDIPNQNVIDILSKEKDSCNIVFVSGRPDDYKQKTIDWLRKYLPFEYQTLIMRHAGDHRPDNEVKTDIANTYFKKENIKVVIDDRPNVIVKTWIPLVGIEKIIDVGNNERFINEREELNYWSN
jgi:tRNA uridine 5-carbamoylmethylation protein Kti12